MLKVIILLLIIFGIETFHAELVFQNAEPILKPPEPDCYTPDPNGVHIKYATVRYNIDDFPPDDTPNFGDRILFRRQVNDTLIVRELIINENVYDVDTRVKYTDTFHGWNITTVRAINVGRQRAYTHMLGLGEKGWVCVQAIIKHGEQIRLLVEAYARPVQN